MPKKLVLPSPSEKVELYLESDTSTKRESKYAKKWLKEFTQFIKVILEFIYEDEPKIVKMCTDGDESFMNIFIRAFTEETESVINNEPVEFFGDNVFNYCLGRFLFIRYNGDLKRSTPDFLSRVENYFKSNPYQEIMSENLNLKKWILKGNKQVNITGKMKANLVESLFGALDFVTTGVKRILCSQKEYELVCKNAFGIEACYVFLKKYFDYFSFNEEDSERDTAVRFFSSELADSFTERGKISFIKERRRDGVDIYYMSIKPDFIELLKKELGLTSEQTSVLENISSLKNESKNELANQIKKIFDKKLNITEDWLEEYKNLSKIRSIPEPYKSELLKKVKGEEIYVNIKFECHKTQRTYKEATMIMYKVKGDDKGNIIDKKILGVITGPHNGSMFPYNLKNELVMKYLEENK